MLLSPKKTNRTIRYHVSKHAPAGKGADLVNYKLITAWYQISEPVSCATWMSYL